MVEQSHLDNAIRDLRTLLNSLRTGPDNELESIAEARDEVLNRFQPIFTPGKLDELSEEDFKDFLLFKNNKHWTGINRGQGTILSDMPRLRHALSVLVDESRPVVERLNFLVPTMAGANYVPGLSKAILTPILLVVYPDKYGVWNGKSEGTMGQLGIWPEFSSQVTFGERYAQVNKILLQLAGALEIDLWTLDSLWWRVPQPQPPDEPVKTAAPMHLLFKWSSDFDPRTIERHLQVAQSQGSVWWGRLGKQESSGMSAARIHQLRAQISSGATTYAFLYRRGEVWRTRLEEITTDPTQVDQSLRPPEFASTQCNLFARLTDFEQLDASWVENNLVPVKNPTTEGMLSALSNQTSPLSVYERTDIEQGTIPPDVSGDVPLVRSLSLDWLEDQTLWARTDLQEIIDALQGQSPQVVLAGPPGTGKTWIAQHIAQFITQGAPGGARVVQLHPSYGYEQFIEGLRPTVDESGIFNFNRIDGVVLQVAKDIRGDGRPRVLIMDEMNRANLPRVFGELMYLFEYRQKPVDLLYTKDFTLPEKLLFIGTMNTADRSIRSIDIALRRRFEVFECPPDVQVLERFYAKHRNDVGSLLSGFEALNAELNAKLDRHHTIGHTFFMSRAGMTRGLLRRVWRRKIGPLIEEYFFDQPDVASEFTAERFWPEVGSAD